MTRSLELRSVSMLEISPMTWPGFPKLFRVLTPMMLSFVSVGVFFKLFYEPTFGIVSYVLNAFTSEPFVMLSTPGGAIAGIVIADAWMWSPFVMLLVLAGLVSVPDYLYEAAEVDRASKWERFKTVTFPYVKGLLLLALLFRTIETFKLFDVVYIITAGGPGSSTETIGSPVKYMKTCEITPKVGS